jgi:hypothetical protein
MVGGANAFRLVSCVTFDKAVYEGDFFVPLLTFNHILFVKFIGLDLVVISSHSENENDLFIFRFVYTEVIFFPSLENHSM